MEHLDIQKMIGQTKDSIYKLVILASRRAVEISEGQPKLIKGTASNLKASVVALAEIAAGKIGLAK